MEILGNTGVVREECHLNLLSMWYTLCMHLETSSLLELRMVLGSALQIIIIIIIIMRDLYSANTKILVHWRFT